MTTPQEILLPMYTHGGKKIGIIDLGSNSARLLLVQLLPDGAYSIINRVKHMVRLGENAFETKMLQEAAMQRTLIVLRSFMDMCKTYGVNEMLPMATAAMRDATNAQEFVTQVYNDTELTLQIIPGQEEARLIYLGISSDLPHSLAMRAFVDIGGGSTEVAIGNSVNHINLDSLKLGCVRLTNLFLEDTNGKVSGQLFESMCQYVRSKASHTIKRIKTHNVKEMVGSSGTALALHTIAYKLQYGTSPSAEHSTISLEGLRKAAKHIRELTIDERKNLPGVNARRAEVLVAGTAILLTLMEEFGFEHMTVSARNLQDGILTDYIQRQRLQQNNATNTLPMQYSNVRYDSVLQLAKRCYYEEKHVHHMAQLALDIHDSAIDCGLIPLDHQARELLHYAALLHDIGIFIAYAKHSWHGAYLIKNTDILGFTQEEIDFLAYLIQYHSMKPNKKIDESPQPTKGLGTHRRLFALFLALAENMDRLHCQNINEAYFTHQDGTLLLEIQYQIASPVEMEAVQNMQKLCKKILGKDLQMHFTPAEQSQEQHRLT